MPKKVSRIDTQPNKNITKVPSPRKLFQHEIISSNHSFSGVRRLWDFRLSTSCCCFSLAAPLRVNLLVPSFWCGCDRPASSVSKMCHFWTFLGVTFKSAKVGKGNHISQTKTLTFVSYTCKKNIFFCITFQQFNSTTCHLIPKQYKTITFHIWNIQKIQLIFRHTNLPTEISDSLGSKPACVGCNQMWDWYPPDAKGSTRHPK